ncbi:PREDICTED: uncharacterized protein LOC104808927 [Tarenaya hassleriana]|uniref:uncharacterized protein LOC104808927 n=1 Tax=Tarenaya hassleriana TaxID=28532 RepID=UPI00053C988F|nr:PREDICTED: uncharacterized protein LOC104808927 [Tarenaya hassleriana]
MGNNLLFLGTLILIFSGFVAPAPSANSPAKIINGFISNHGSSLMKWLWSLKTTSKKTVISSRSMVRYENGYTVETVFDGSKLGVEPYSVEVLPNGELIILDSANSNIYKISSSLSLYSRPRLVTGSPEGYSGHVDGRLREARLNHPKGITVDDRGNIYVADTMNNAIRKISDGGVTTIAGGKNGRGSHVDGPSEDAKFSNDFDIVYVGSSCSLLVIDRGNRAIREIQLHFDDCAYQYGSGFPLGIAVLVAAGFFGYMLALLQSRVGSIMSSYSDQEIYDTSLDQKPLKSVRSPLIPTEGDKEKQEESLFGSLGNLVSNSWASFMEIFGGILPHLGKKHQETRQFSSAAAAETPWPVQESFVIQDEDGPPPIEPRNPTPKKTYAFMSKDAEKMNQLRQSRAFYSSWDMEFHHQQKQKQHHRRHHSSVPHTFYEQSSEKTNEMVFGAVQELDMAAAAAAVAVDSGKHPTNGYQSVRYRSHSGSYPYM